MNGDLSKEELAIYRNNDLLVTRYYEYLRRNPNNEVYEQRIKKIQHQDACLMNRIFKASLYMPIDAGRRAIQSAEDLLRRYGTR